MWNYFFEARAMKLAIPEWTLGPVFLHYSFDELSGRQGVLRDLLLNHWKEMNKAFAGGGLPRAGVTLASGPEGQLVRLETYEDPVHAFCTKIYVCNDAEAAMDKRENYIDVPLPDGHPMEEPSAI
ncbi:MAG: hypothetical protein Q8Q78_14315 [Hydrogenophaga sp.]|nr:hypothetical protein [Hydrogenophaga sp.]